MIKKSLYVIGILFVIVILNSGSIYAATNEKDLTVMTDDPQAGRESGEMLDGFFDDTSNDGLNTVEDPYGISLMSIPYGYTHASKYANYNVINGIDVSYYQGDIDWNAVKADGIDFAIIRVGYRGYGTSGNLKEDTRYVQNIQGALNAGVQVGVYIFSQATTTAEAVEEADFLLNRIARYNITFPVVIDYEYASVSGSTGGRLYDAHLSRREATEVCKAFCARVASGGYTPMIYANKSMLRNSLYADELSANYHIWLANYTYSTDYEGNYSCWQYTSNGSVSGISGRVDMNFWYENSSTTYQGVDYSAVYDYDYYMNTYSDLKLVYGGNRRAALQHFVEYGMAEGRQGNAEFNVYTYRNRYTDLRSAYRNDLKSYYMHYVQYGKNEGRTAYGVAQFVPITVYNGVDYSAVYDYNYYISTYGDLQAAFGNDDVGALQHFVEHGMAEGRQGNAEFNVYIYINRYLDLRRGYKNDLRGYYMHYILAGKLEGRSGSGEAQFVGETIYNGVDYAAVYDYEYYCSQNPDLKNAFGADENALLQHFVEHGMDEGRQGSAEFNVIAYRNRYDDLRAGYGNDNKGYYLHYLYSGKAEGRDGSALKESDYAAVYNYETYLALNPDIQASYGNDRNAVLQHFVGHGMLEGRQASNEFNVYAYMNRYEDLNAGFGNDLKGYYLHYIQAGQAEGRNGKLEESTSLGIELLTKEKQEMTEVLEQVVETETEIEPEVNPEGETGAQVELEVNPEGEMETEVGDDAKSEQEMVDTTENEVEEQENAEAVEASSETTISE